MNKKIIFSSGGTGGHIFPAINLMKYFSEKGYEVLIVTDKRGKNFLKYYSNFKSYVISAETPVNKNLIKKIFAFFVMFYAFLKSILILKKEKPNLIFGFGGYISFPISFASRFFKIPLVIYENNMVLGIANKNLLSFSKRLLLGANIPVNFPSKYKDKVYKVGNILRKEIIDYTEKEKKTDSKIFSILVLGGSQGAEIFGEIIPSVIKKIKNEGYEIAINQQCLEYQKNSIIDFYDKNKIKNNVFNFTDNILNLISSSHLAISRCGASSLAELKNTLTPFIAVPLPHATDNHQYLNAKYYEKQGFCWIMEQDNFSLINLFNLIMTIIKDRKKLEIIKKSMRNNNDKNVYINVENAIKEFI